MPRHPEGVKRPKNLSDGGRKLYGTEVLVRNVSAEFGEILLPTAVGIRMTLSYGDRQLRRVHVTLREVHDRRVSSMGEGKSAKRALLIGDASASFEEILRPIESASE
jgi:hypothetical protein